MRRWTKEDVDLAVTLHNQGVPASGIAVRLDRTKHAVSCMLTRYRHGKLSRKITMASDQEEEDTAFDHDRFLRRMSEQSLAKAKPVRRGLFRWLFGV
jgi:hypothetical protein